MGGRLLRGELAADGGEEGGVQQPNRLLPQRREGMRGKVELVDSARSRYHVRLDGWPKALALKAVNLAASALVHAFTVNRFA